MTARAGSFPARQQGFTLVELSVALLVFGLIATAAVALLSFSVGAQASANARLDELGQIERSGALMTADFAQAVPRLTRDDAGLPLAAVDGGNGSLLVRFVRLGWTNSEDAGRSNLQRVEYRFVEDRLERTVWPRLDGAAALPPAVLAAGLQSVSIRFRSENEWRERWDATRADAMPRAVELTMVRADGVEVIQLFLVGTGQRQ